MSRTARIARNSVAALTRNRLRTSIMMLGTFVGICALTVILAIGRGTQRDVMQKIDRMLSGSTILLRSGGGQFRAGLHGPPATTLTVGDLRVIDAELKQVEHVDPMLMTGPREVVYGGKSGRIRMEGHSEAAQIVWNRTVTRGAYFTRADVASAARVALVGEHVARDLFGGRDPIGEQIRVGTVPFEVIGVLEPVGLDPHGLDKDNEILIPITTMMRRVMNVDYVQGAKLALSPGTDPAALVPEITRILRDRHSIGAGQLDDFMMFTPVQVQLRVRAANRVFTVFLPLIAAISILVGGLVVANLMLMNVSERRSEIGLRKAVGARPRDIGLQFVLESVAVTTLGGILALLAGVGVLRLLAHLIRTPPGMAWDTALLGLGVAVLVGVFAGLAPARRAARLDPVQTLR